MPRFDRRIFGQFAEHLGTGIYGGMVPLTAKSAFDQGDTSHPVRAERVEALPFIC